MKVNRMLRWAEILDKVPAAKFKMSSWVNECGTTACALGWAGLDPKLRRAGLRTDPKIGGVRFGDKYCALMTRSNATGADIAEQFFGITWGQAFELVYGPSCRPTTKARQIRKMVAQHLREKVTVEGTRGG